MIKKKNRYNNNNEEDDNYGMNRVLSLPKLPQPNVKKLKLEGFEPANQIISTYSPRFANISKPFTLRTSRNKDGIMKSLSELSLFVKVRISQLII